MAKIEVTTRNGDKMVVNTTNRAEIEQLENSPFDPSANVSSVRVTGGR